MGWLERLPPLVKILFVIGGFFLSAFASQFPEGFKTVAAYCGLLLVALGLMGAGLHWLKEKRGGDKVIPADFVILGAAGMVLFGIILVGGLIWRANYKPEQRTTPTNPLNDTVLIECVHSPLPATMTESPVSMMQLGFGGGGLVQITGKVGTDFSDWNYQQSFKCQITNYGKEPVFNVQMDFSTITRKAEPGPEPHSVTSGSVIKNEPWPIQISRIDVGPENPFVFWVINNSLDFIQVRLPVVASYSPLGKAARETMSLIRPSNQDWFFVLPFTPRIPPAPTGTATPLKP